VPDLFVFPGALGDVPEQDEAGEFALPDRAGGGGLDPDDRAVAPDYRPFVGGHRRVAAQALPEALGHFGPLGGQRQFVGVGLEQLVPGIAGDPRGPLVGVDVPAAGGHDQDTLIGVLD